MIGAFQCQIDKAGDPLALAYRNLPRDQRRRAHRLERRQQLADRSARLVDAIDEDHMRHAQRLELPQRGFGERRSEEHTSELQSLISNTYDVFCSKKKTYKKHT